MPNDQFIFSVNTLAGCKYSVLRELERKFQVQENYQKKYRSSKRLSMLTTALSYFDNLRYQTLSRNLEISKDPIYILGHWRSGTTLLHSLLCSHDKTSYPTTYQTVFPNNLFFLSTLLKGIMAYYLPKERLVDHVEMDVNYPQEEDFALGNEAGFSFYYWFYFPADHQRIVEEYLSLPAKDHNRNLKHKEDYKTFIKRCLLNVGGEQYIAKNPPNMARIPFLLDLFPKSRFVYIERNPYEVLLSTFRFHKGFLRTLQLQDIEDDSLWDFIFSTYRTLYEMYLDNKHLIPVENLVEIKYEQLVSDPGKTFGTLHNGIFSDLETNESKLRSVIERNRKHSPNTYHFKRAYKDRVNAAVGDMMQQQGYPLR